MLSKEIVHGLDFGKANVVGIFPQGHFGRALNRVSFLHAVARRNGGEIFARRGIGRRRHVGRRLRR